jgi:type II secretory pathway pseudopilin PulG
MTHSSRRHERGYAMAALLVSLAVIGVIIGMAMPVWRTVVQREREEELIFRGRQYARAIQLFQRKYANAYPPNVDVLVEQRFLRKKYKDPVNKDGEFEILYQATLAQRAAAQGGRGGASLSSPGGVGQRGATSGSSTGSTSGTQVAGPQGGVVGVVSKNKSKSIRVYDGRSVYSEWQFIWVPAAAVPRTGPAGSVGPGQRGMQPGGGRSGPGPGGVGPGGQMPPRGRGPGGPGSPSGRPPG